MRPTMARGLRLLSLPVALAALCGTGCRSRATPHPAPAQGKPASFPEALDRAADQWRRIPRATPLTSQAGVAGSAWKPIGPSPISEPNVDSITIQANGRVNSIAADPSNPGVIYLGSAGGGVWRGPDDGSAWTPLTDHQISSGIGTPSAIAFDPGKPGTLYVGTSSFALLAQSLPRPMEFAQSRGILKSSDGGDSWIVLGSGFPAGNTGNAATTISGTNINAILVDPADGNVLYLAAGPGSAPDRSGLYRSTDGGRNWTLGANGAGVAQSLAMDPSSPPGARVLYAGVTGSGVRRSSDGGLSWTQVLSLTTPAVAAATSAFGKAIVRLAPPSAPPNPAGAVVYVTLPGAAAGGAALLFENTAGGAEAGWFRRNAQVAPPSTPMKGDVFSDMAVDPASPGDGSHDIIYWGGFSQYVSTDSGDNFVEIGEINGTHGDAQTFLVVPQPSGISTVYAGDDGGIWKSTDQGAKWTGSGLPGSPPTINAGGLQIGTFYKVAVKPDSTGSATLGGTQDSGLLFADTIPLWKQGAGSGGDGFDVVFDRMAPSNAYAVVNGCGGDCLLKSTDSGASWTDVTPASIPSGERGQQENRLAVDPNHAGTLFVGGSAGSVFRTTDGGASFQSIGTPGGTPSPGQYVTSLDVAPGSSDHLVIARSGRGVFAAANALAVPAGTVAFADITGDLPGRFVTRVAFDPGDPAVVYAALAGFDADTPARPGHVFRKTLGEAAWTDISPPVDLPVNAMALDGATVPAALYVGTDLGVLRTFDGGASWSVVDDVHLPRVAVSDLALDAPAGVLRAATWGRGVFELAAPSGPVIAVAAQNGLDFGAACPGSTLAIEVSSVGTQDLVVASVERILGSTDFAVLPDPATPLTLAPGAHADFTVRFTPTAPGPESALIRIRSNDPGAPVVDLLATGARETTPPVIGDVAATPDVLWPPNHRMVPVKLAVTVADNCDAAVAASCHIVAIASTEPVLGPGSGHASPDWENTGSLSANLRAERSGSGTGRRYALTVQCTDASGNSASRDASVTVPHDRGH